jgi:hypothetical protein
VGVYQDSVCQSIVKAENWMQSVGSDAHRPIEKEITQPTSDTLILNEMRLDMTHLT